MTHDAADYAQAIATELRAQRGRTRQTVASLVDDTGLSKSAVLNYLNGHRDIPLSVLAKLCRALDMEPTEVVRRAEELLART